MMRMVRNASAIVFLLAVLVTSGATPKADNYCNLACDWYPWGAPWPDAWEFVCADGESCESVTWCVNNYFGCIMGSCNPTASVYGGPVGSAYCPE